MKLVIFDLDGTIYPHDTPENEFRGSSYFKQINKNIRKLIFQKEKTVSEEEITEIIELAWTNSPSKFLSKRYNISIEEYFNEVYNINPKGIVTNFETQKKFIEKLVSDNIDIILVSGSPKIWVENAVKFMGLTSFFKKIYSNYDHGTKEVVFSKYAKEYSPENILVIGDELKNDILPAQKLGIKYFHIKSPIFFDVEQINKIIYHE